MSEENKITVESMDNGTLFILDCGCTYHEHVEGADHDSWTICGEAGERCARKGEDKRDYVISAIYHSLRRQKNGRFKYDE